LVRTIRGDVIDCEHAIANMAQRGVACTRARRLLVREVDRELEACFARLQRALE
jgi:hypothetical protein